MISGLLEGEDVLNTANAMRALGARVERAGQRFHWSVRGVGVAGFAPTNPRAGFRQFRNRLPPGDGRGRRLADWCGDI